MNLEITPGQKKFNFTSFIAVVKEYCIVLVDMLDIGLTLDTYLQYLSWGILVVSAVLKLKSVCIGTFCLLGLAE